MSTFMGILKSAKHKITYHHIALSLLIMGYLATDLVGDLIGWERSTGTVIGAVLVTGGCYLATWKIKNNKALLFLSGFFTALLLCLLILKFKGSWF